MRVLLESTSQTVELAYQNKSGGNSFLPARIWQGFTNELDRAALVKELRDLANGVTQSEVIDRLDLAQRLRNAAALVEKPGEIEVHAFITRIMHKLDEPQRVVDRFKSELQVHAAPRPEYERAYSLRMFI